MKIPEEVTAAWGDMQGPAVLTTISEDRVPNSIYATCVSLFDTDKVLVANNKFDKTLRNISANDQASVLFITSKRKAYQIKGKVRYDTHGAAYDNMKTWNRSDLPGFGVAVLEVKSVYSGAEKLL